jgi:hypothetical protein
MYLSNNGFALPLLNQVRTDCKSTELFLEKCYG